MRLECPLESCRMPFVVIEVSGQAFPLCNHLEAYKKTNQYNKPIWKEWRDAARRQAELSKLQDDDS
jgi:hypothetical protein